MWEKSNHLNLMLMESCVSKSIQGAEGEVIKAKDFFRQLRNNLPNQIRLWQVP